jgi:hypothetical protein
VSVFELVVASILALLGLRSVVVWARRPIAATSFRDHLLYALFVTARAGTWFGLAGVFLAYALVTDDSTVRPLAIIPVALAGVSVVCSFALGRTSG